MSDLEPNCMKKSPGLVELVIAFGVVIVAAVYLVAAIAKITFGFTWAQFHEFMGAAIPAAMAVICVGVLVGVAVYSVYSVYSVFIKKR